MRNSNLLQEMSMEEMKSTEGGFLFFAILLATAAATLIGLMMEHGDHA